jgi:hypothetical protein
LMCGVLCLAVVGLVCRGPTERVWWLGFNLFGWGYWKLAFWEWSDLLPFLPTTSLLTWLGLMIGFPADYFGNRSGIAFLQTGQCLLTIMIATLGGLLARACFEVSVGRLEKGSGSPLATVAPARRFWLWPVIVGSAAIGLISFIGFSGSKLDPELKAGAIYLLTRGLIGVACMGAFLGRGKAREIWLGAGLFGAGYMFIAFDRSAEYHLAPNLPADQVLTALRLGWPATVRAFSSETFGVTAANTRVLNLLEQPIPMRFREDTPIEEILQYIQGATRGPDGKGIPIYVDPIGLQEAEKSMSSTVSLVDLEGVPLKTSLRLCMDQLGLRYEVSGGMVQITAADQSSWREDDSFTTAGHCVLALIAAAVGGALAPLISGLRCQPVA